MADPQDPTFSNTGQSGVELGGQGTLMGFVQSLVNIHAQRQKSAAGDLDRQLLAAQKGFPVDPKAIEKNAKKAGIPLMKPEDMKGLLEKPAQQGQQGGGAKPSIDTQQPDQYAQAYNTKAIADVKQRQQAETGHAVDGIVRQAVTNYALKGATDQMIMEHTKNLMTLKDQALNGDARAYGTLLRSGEIKPDINAEQWEGLDAKQKSTFLDTLAGYETPAQKAARVQTGATHLMTEGYFASPEDATKAATILADGGSLPPDLQAKMRPVGLADMAKEVGIADTMAEIGLPPTEIWGMARKAGLVGVGSAMPTGFQTIQQKLLEQKNKQLGIEGMNAQTSRMDVVGYTDKSGKKIPGRLETQAESVEIRDRAEADMAKIKNEQLARQLDLQARTADQKTSLDQYKALVDLKRAKGNAAVSDAVMQAAEMDVAKKFGVELEPVDNLMHWLTGGTHLENKGSTTSTPAQSTPTSKDDTDPAAAAAGTPQ